MIIILKGDANEDPDLQIVTTENIVGKVMFSIPFIGYVGSLVRTSIGYTFLVLIPGIILIVFETRNIIRELKTNKSK